MMRSSKIDLKTRQTWFKKHTEASVALNQLLKDREMRDWEKRLEQIEQYRKNARAQAESESSIIDENNQSKQAGQV